MLAINTKKPKLNANYNILGEKNRKPLNSRARQGVLKLNTKSRITQKGKLTNWTSSKFETSLYKSPREDETSYRPAESVRKPHTAPAWASARHVRSPRACTADRSLRSDTAQGTNETCRCRADADGESDIRVTRNHTTSPSTRETQTRTARLPS